MPGLTPFSFYGYRTPRVTLYKQVVGEPVIETEYVLAETTVTATDTALRGALTVTPTQFGFIKPTVTMDAR